MLQIFSRAGVTAQYTPTSADPPGTSPRSVSLHILPSEIMPKINGLIRKFMKFSITMRAANNEFEMVPKTGVANATAGTPQVRTTTFTIGTVLAGTLNITVTSRETGTITVPVVLSGGENLTAVTTAILAALRASALDAYWVFASSVAGTLTATARIARTNDATFNIAIPTALGVVTGTGTATTAGAGGVTYDVVTIDEDGTITEAPVNLESVACIAIRNSSKSDTYVTATDFVPVDVDHILNPGRTILSEIAAQAETLQPANYSQTLETLVDGNVYLEFVIAGYEAV